MTQPRPGRRYSLCFVLIAIFTFSSLARAQNLSVSPSPLNASTNEIFFLDVRNTNGKPFHGAGIYMKFDPTFLQVWDKQNDTPAQSVETSSALLDVGLLNAVDNDAGEIKVALGVLKKEGIQGSGTLFHIPFKALRSGNTQVTFQFLDEQNKKTELNFSGTSIPISIQDGNLTISAPLKTIVITPGDVTVEVGQSASFSAQGIDEEGVTKPITPAWHTTGGTIDAGGNFTAPATPTVGRMAPWLVFSDISGGDVVVRQNELMFRKASPTEQFKGGWGVLPAYPPVDKPLDRSHPVMFGGINGLSAISFEWTMASNVSGTNSFLTLTTGSFFDIIAAIFEAIASGTPSLGDVDAISFGATSASPALSGSAFIMSQSQGANMIDSTPPDIQTPHHYRVEYAPPEQVVSLSFSTPVTSLCYLTSSSLVYSDGSSISNGSIYSMNVDGSGRTMLSSGADPACSSSGKIAFSRQGRIFLMNEDGSNITAVTPEGLFADHPSFSPDETHLVFRGDGNKIYTITADGVELTLLTSGAPVQYPVYSPSGNSIAYLVGVTYPSLINVIDTEGNAPGAAAADAMPTRFAYLTDSTLLYTSLTTLPGAGPAFSSAHITSVNVNGQNKKNLLTSMPMMPYGFSLSPDRETLTFFENTGFNLLFSTSSSGVAAFRVKKLSVAGLQQPGTLRLFYDHGKNPVASFPVPEKFFEMGFNVTSSAEDIAIARMDDFRWEGDISAVIVPPGQDSVLPSLFSNPMKLTQLSDDFSGQRQVYATKDGVQSEASVKVIETQAPTQVTDLSAGVAEDFQKVRLQWTKALDNFGVDHYKLLRDVSPITESNKEAAALVSETISDLDASYDDSAGALQIGTPYYYVLSAVDASGNVAPVSNNASVLISTDKIMPAKITDLNAESKTSPDIFLTWSKPQDNGELDYFTLYRDTQTIASLVKELPPVFSEDFSGVLDTSLWQVQVGQSLTAIVENEKLKVSGVGTASIFESSGFIRLQRNFNTSTRVAVEVEHSLQLAGRLPIGFSLVSSTSGGGFSGSGVFASFQIVGNSVNAVTPANQSIPVKILLPGSTHGYKIAYDNGAYQWFIDGEKVYETQGPIVSQLTLQLTFGFGENTSFTALYDNVRVYSGQPAELSPLATVSSSQTSYTDGTGTPGTTYYYVATATDGGGNTSALSNVASATAAFSGDDRTPPAAVTDLSAQLGTGTQVLLYWTPPTDNVAVARVQVLRLENEAITNANTLSAKILTNTLTANTATYTDTTALPGKTYYYAVTSFDTSNNQSALSNSPFVNVPSVTDNEPPQTITDLAAVSTEPGKVNLSWSEATDNIAVERYEVTRSQAGNVLFTESFNGTTLNEETWDVLNQDPALTFNVQNGKLSVTSGALTQSPALLIASRQIFSTSQPIFFEGEVSFNGTENVTLGLLGALSSPVFLGPAFTLSNNAIQAVLFTSSGPQAVGALYPAQAGRTYRFQMSYVSGTVKWSVNDQIIATKQNVSVTSPQLTLGVLSNQTGSTITQATYDNLLVFQGTDTFKTLASLPSPATSYVDTTGVPQSTYLYAVKSVDTSNNVSVSSNKAFATVISGDASAPVITLLSPAQGSFTQTGTPLVEATVTDASPGVDAARIKVLVDSSVLSSSYDAGTSMLTAIIPVSSPLTEGAHTLTIQAYDKDGNYTTKSATFTVDKTAPVIVFQSPQEGSLVNTKDIVVTANVTDAASGVDAGSIVLKADGVAYPFDFNAGTGVLTYTWPSGITDGLHTVTLDVKDKVGNASQTAQRTFTLDASSPLVKNIQDAPDPFSPGNSIGVKDSTTITGNVEDVHPKDWRVTVASPDNVTLKEFSGQGTTVSGTWDGKDANNMPVVDGLYNYAILASDTAGNFSNDGQKQEIVLLEDTFTSSDLVPTKWTVANDDPGILIAPYNGVLRISGSATSTGGSPIGNGVRSSVTADSTKNFNVMFDVDISNSRLAVPGSISANVVVGNPGVGTTVLLQFYKHSDTEYELRFAGQSFPMTVAAAHFKFAYDAMLKNVSVFVDGTKKAETTLNLQDGSFSFLAAGGAPTDSIDVRYDNFKLVQENVLTQDTSGSITVDNTSPQAFITFSTPPYAAGFDTVVSGTNGAVISGNDPVVNGVSGGIETLLYSVDVGLEQTYASSFLLQEGRRRIDFKAVDKAGNVSVPDFFMVSVDATAPATTLSPVPQPFTKTKNFTLTANDPRVNDISSGVKEIRYKLDGGFEQVYTSGITPTEGFHTIEYFSIDNVGNEEQHHSVTFTVDTAKPEVTNISDTPDPFSPGASAGVKDTSTISANVNDANPDSWQLQLFDAGNNPVQTFNGSGSFITQLWNGTISTGGIAPDGLYAYSILATDKAGNTNKEASGGTTTNVLLQDDFNDGFLDPVKWDMNMLPSDPGLTVTEENGYLRISGNPQAQNTGDNATGVAGLAQGDGTKKLSVSVDVDVSHSQVPQNGQPVVSLVLLGNPSTDALITMNVVVENGAYMLMYQTFSGQQGMLGTIPAQGNVKLTYDPASSRITIYFNNEQKATVPMTVLDTALTVLAATGSVGSIVDVRFDNVLFTQEEASGGNPVQISDTFDDGVIDTNTWDMQNFRGHNWYTLEEKEGTLVFSGSGDTFDPEFVATKQTVSSQKDFVLSVQLDLSESVAAGGGSMSQTPVTGPVAVVGVGNSLKFYASALSQQPTQTYRLYAFSPELGFVTLTDLPTGAGLMVFSYTAQTQKLSVVFNGTHQTDLTTTFNEEPLVALLGAAKDAGDTLKVKFDNFSLTQGSGNGGGEGASPIPDGFITVDNTNPASALTPSVALFNNQYAATGTTYSLSAEDPVVNGVNSGVEKIEVQKDNEAFFTYTSALSLDEGKHALKHKATDNAGNMENEKAFSVDVDGTAPVSALAPSAALFNNAYASLATTYGLSATDPVVKEVSSGVLKTVYKIDNGEETQYSNAITLTEGAHTIAYFSKDNVLNTEQEKTFTVKIDNTAPVTQVVSSAPLYADKYAPVSTTYTFSATDPASFGVASGVSKIEYTLDGGVTNVYNGNSIALTEGVHTFVFYATDNVGNTEAQKTFTVHIDNTPPTTTASAGEPKYSTADKQYVSVSTPITLNATDPTVANVSSGFASTQYKMDSGNYANYTGAFTLSEGIHTITFKSTDNVGNTEQEKTQTFHVDATPPSAQIAFNATNCTDNGKTVVSGQTQFTLAANDPMVSDVSSGIKELRFRVNGGAWQSYTVAFTLLGLAQDGDVTIEVVALDNVENTSSAQSITVVLDSTPPVATILSPQDKSVINNTIAVMGTVTDTHFTGSSVQGAGGSGQYTLAFGAGQNPTSFTAIATGTMQNTCTAQSASCDPLTTWSTSALTQNTLYILKLTANDCVGNVATAQALLRIGDPEFILTFGTQSHGGDPAPGTFKDPSGLVSFKTDIGTENLLVSDTMNNRVQVFKESGEFVATFGQKTQGQPDPGEFEQPADITTDSLGNIYVVDSLNDRVQKFDKNYAFIAAYGTHGNALGEFNKPYGVAVDAQGNLFITDENNNRVQKLDANGTPIKEWTQIKQTVNGQDVFYSLNKPTGIVIDANGNLYVSDSHNDRIVKFTQDGTLLRIYDATGQTQAPDSYGDHPLKQPLGITFDTFGNLYAADQMNHRIQKLDPWGNRLLNFGVKSTGQNNGGGTFNQTADVTLDTTSKFVYVSDVKNHRMQKFAVVIDAPVIAKLASQKNDDKNAIISDPNLLNVLKVMPYPTPSRGKLSFNLEAEGNVTQITLEVYTINGKRVLTEFLPVQAATGAKGKGKFKAESPSLDAVLQSLPNGVYVYRLQISNGVKTVNKTGKFVLVK